MVISSGAPSPSVDCGRNLITHLGLDAEGRILLPEHRFLSLFESPVLTQTRVWDGWYDLGFV